LHTHFLAGCGVEGVEGFQTAGSPLPAVVLGGDLQGAGCYLAVGAGAGVDFLLAVGGLPGPELPEVGVN